jgi:hypothetical protein
MYGLLGWEKGRTPKIWILGGEAGTRPERGQKQAMSGANFRKVPG